jgi:nucleotide-binding universal stress UspA family protein
VVSAAKDHHGRTEGILASGEPWRAILAKARELDCDLILMGTHGRRGLERALVGSVAEKVVRLSPIPVLTISSRAERDAREGAAKSLTLDHAE